MANPFETAVLWCGACGHSEREPHPRPTYCPSCGALFGRAVHGAVVELPAGFTPCSRCGTQEATVFFRGWSRLYAFWLTVTERRSSAYVCGDCAAMETAKSLFVTAFRGWWALQSLWHAPRSTYFNWRSVWAPPRNPVSWGAMPLDELLEAINRETNQEDAPQNPVVGDSPLDYLSPAEQQMVLEVSDPYAALGVGAHATEAEIKAAWRKQAKANHPDLNQGDPGAEARMRTVNQAYEILGDERLRAAYDWLIESGSRPS